MQNLILLDWLSATRPRTPTVNTNDDDTGFSMITALGMQDCHFQIFDGVKGFGKRLWFDGISIHLPSDKMPYIWLEMSGSGCRAFETYGHGSWHLLLNTLIQMGCNIKRIDIAHDDHTGILDMSSLINDTLNELYVSKSNKHEVIIGLDDTTHERDCSIYHFPHNTPLFPGVYRFGYKFLSLVCQPSG